jgi:CHAD domain-containing protein
MAIAFDRVEKPLRQLRRSLSKLAADPPPEDVHKLRTRARHIEAIAMALSPAGEKLARRLLKSIKPLRKAAGRVRDMDVLAVHARTLPLELHGESVASLLEHLESSRKKHAANLLEILDHHQKQARDQLKQYAAQIEKHKGSAPRAREIERQVRSAAASHTAELGNWPALNARNLHSFRLKVKELRSVLQLLSGADQALVDALGIAKDKIGEWHDWLQLAKAAAEALDAGQHRALLTLIRQNGQQKLNEALACANALRQRYFERPLKKPPIPDSSLDSSPERRSSAAAVTRRPNQAA